MDGQKKNSMQNYQYGGLVTEEDTFNALQKLPFDQLATLVYNAATSSDEIFDEEKFKSYGWTFEEFFNTLESHLGLKWETKMTHSTD